SLVEFRYSLVGDQVSLVLHVLDAFGLERHVNKVLDQIFEQLYPFVNLGYPALEEVIEISVFRNEPHNGPPLSLFISILPVLLDPVESIFPGQQPALKLGFFYRIQDLFELRSGLQSQSDEVVAAEQPWRRNLGGAK